MRKNTPKPGHKFYRLTVVGRSHVKTRPNGAKVVYYDCRCDCGEMTKVMGTNITGKHPVKSCGCLQRDVWKKVREEGLTHGKRHTRTYRLWAKMMERGKGQCCPENYVDRGITVCPEWYKFENFYRDMGDCPKGLSLDRIDNDKGYFPGNCRWATSSQQARNKRTTWRVTYKGETLPGYDLAERHGLEGKCFYSRVHVLGWPVEKALLTPVRKIKKK